MKTIPKSMHQINLTVFLSLLFLLSSCSEDGIGSPENSEVVILSTTADTIVHVMVGNDKVPIYLSIPKGCDKKSFPAVVVMHGSGGMWKDNDPEGGTMSTQNREWRELFDQNCIVGAFVDSYSCRGIAERTGKWEKPPYIFKSSSQFIRPRDANATLALLRKLKFSDGSSVVRTTDVGLLGFSDGGTALFSTLFDTDTTPMDWEWTQSYDGKEYGASDGVLAPEEKPDIGFAGGIFYYGGSSGHGYWGSSPCKPNAMQENIYNTYAPILYQIPEEDSLTENTLCMFNLLKAKNNNVELKLYQGVGHGFDTDGVEQSYRARENSIAWFKEILNMD